jgi:hypothetical protein
MGDQSQGLEHLAVVADEAVIAHITSRGSLALSPLAQAVAVPL